MTLRARTTGFTLLEVLIAVVVLAFGLLGVVAVFPAVIDVQRRAQDAVLGGSLAASAEAYLNASVLDSETLDWVAWDDLPGAASDIRRFPTRELLTNDRSISSLPGNGSLNSNDVDLDFLWDVPAIDDEGRLEWGGGQAGAPFRFQADGDPTGLQRLPTIGFDVGQRLLPDEASGDSPRYVWDALVRRVDVGIGSPASTGDRSRVTVPADRLPELPVEVVIFVRPIDRGIRVPAGLSLRESLRGYRFTGGERTPLVRDELDPDERFFPVTVSEGAFENPRPGVSLDAGARYSLPIIAVPGASVGDPQSPGAGVSRLRLDRDIDFGGSALTPVGNQFRAIRALGQAGQLFVDDFGIVHRVTRVIEDEDDAERVTIEFSPPLNPAFRQIVFTPQVPADIRVVRTR